MPIHDWSCVDSGIFHDFHQAWTIEIINAMNGGGLGAGIFAVVDEIDSVATPDAITPANEGAAYAARANRIAIRHRLGKVVAVIEIVSPGNKGSQHALRSFVEKAADLLRQGINLLIVDLFPPSRRDPQGIHGAIWEQFRDDPFELPADKPLTVAAYAAGEPLTAYVEPVAVGDPLPALPIFLDQGTYVPAPLEATYQSTWDKCPEPVRELVESSDA